MNRNKRQPEIGQLKPITVGKLTIPTTLNKFGYAFPDGTVIKCPIKGGCGSVIITNNVRVTSWGNLN